MGIEPTDINVLELLPQRPPFIMVDRLVYYEPHTARTVFTVRGDNMFCMNGVVEEALLVENIAQTCAARTGFKQLLENTPRHCEASPQRWGSNPVSHIINTLRSPLPIKIGVIAMIQSMDIGRRPLVGETLETTMVIEEEVFSTTLVSSEVKVGDETIASCRMKLVLTDNTPN